MALLDSEMPQGIREIRDYVARTFNDGSTRDIWVNAADHEGLSPGAYSIALEGAYEWPMWYQEHQYQGLAPGPEGWYIECLNGWCLAVYPERSDDDLWEARIWARPGYMD